MNFECEFYRYFVYQFGLTNLVKVGVSLETKKPTRGWVGGSFYAYAYVKFDVDGLDNPLGIAASEGRNSCLNPLFIA